MNELENALAEKTRNGDIQAFEDLITGYEKLVFNVAYRMLGNAEDAKDAAQDVFIKIYKNMTMIGTMKRITAFKSWVYTVTNNTCIDYIRKRKGKDTVSIDALIETDDGAMVRQIPSDEPTPEAALSKAERAEQIQAGINRLKPKYKTMIVLRDIKGLSYEEIAEITNAPMGTVKSGLSRARLSLKSILTEMMEQNEL